MFQGYDNTGPRQSRNRGGGRGGVARSSSVSVCFLLLVCDCGVAG